MADQAAVPAPRMSAEFVAIVAIGVTLLLAMFSQFIWLDGKFGLVDGKFERMEGKFGARFEQIDAKFERMEARFDARFEQLDRKIDNLAAELRAEIGILRAGQASLDKRLAVVESHVLGVPLTAPEDAPAAPAS